jgi:hypothetical protein
MPLQALRSTDIISVSYDTMHGWLYADWHGELDLQAVDTGCALVLECLAAVRCTKLLNDNSQVRRLANDIVLWNAPGYLQELAAGGLQYLAWVLSGKHSYNPALITSLRFTHRPFFVPFDDLMAALDWLRHCDSLYMPAYQKESY